MARYMYDHVHLISPNPVKAVEFYEHAFGATRTVVAQRCRRNALGQENVGE